MIKSHVTITIVTNKVTTKVTSVTMTKQQIKSKQRVADHGEVFTREQEVNAMLDLVEARELEDEATYLEPACGDGNFLIAILKRKLKKVEKSYAKNQRRYEFYAIRALYCLYGIELLEDNVIACRKRLFDYMQQEYERIYPERNEKYYVVLKHILELNIVHGNALSMTYAKPNEEGEYEMLTFSHWTAQEAGIGHLKWKIKRHDFTYQALVDRRDDSYHSLSKQEYYSHYFLDIQNAKPIHKL